MNRNYFILGLTVLSFLVLCIVLIPFPLSVSFANKKAFSDPVKITYTGQGTLYACTAEGDSSVYGENTVKTPAPIETATGKERSVLIYTPPGFNHRRVYPVLFLLHGFAARPSFWINNLIPSIEEAIIRGDIPPFIVIMPDGTIGGNGLDDPKTPVDERGGCWYIDSNRVQYERFLLEDLPPFIKTIARINENPETTVIAGSSMGGYAAAYYTLKHPDHFQNAGLFYPCLDLRYTVGNKRLAPYKTEKYAAVTKDRPYRIINKAIGAGILGLTEKWCYYPVFNSDSEPGEVWTDDLPVWQRMREVNPADILKSEEPDLNGFRYFILTGSKDDFNFDDHQHVVLPLLERAGAVIEPEETIVPEGRHDWETVRPSVPAFIRWLGETVRQQP